MNYDQYYPLALRTAPPFKSAPEDFRHCMYGLTTEIGEFVSDVKRQQFYGVALSEVELKNMRKELGDALWYTAVGIRGLSHLGAELPDPSDSLLKNMAKIVQDLDGGVAMLTMLAGAFNVEYHAVQYYGQPNFQQIGRALKALICTIDAIAPLAGTTGDQLRADNIDKLRKRFPEGFSGEAAEARADVGGLSHRES